MKKLIPFILFTLFIIPNLNGQSIKKILSDANRSLKKVKSKKISTTKKTEALNNAYNLYIEAYRKDSNIITAKKNKLNIEILRDSLAKFASNQFNKENYKDAFQNFEKALILSQIPQIDTNIAISINSLIFQTGLSAFKCKEYNISEKYLLQCIENKYNEGIPYEKLSVLYDEIGFESKSMTILEKGHIKYPGSKDIQIGFINHFIKINLPDSAINHLTQIIEKDSINPTYFFARGAIYEEKARLLITENVCNPEYLAEFEQKAINDYKHSIALKPDYFDAFYNLGVLFYNKAVYIYKEADNVPINKLNEFKSKQEDAKSFLKIALPFFEKAHEIDKEDIYTNEVLKTIYKRLKMNKQDNTK